MSLISIPNEIKYLISHIDRWVSDDPEENLRSVKHRIALLLYLESQKSESMLRDDFIIFIQNIIKSLKGDKVFGNCIGIKYENKLNILFKGIEEDKLFTSQLKEYLKKLKAGYLNQNKKIIEFI